MSRAKVPHRVYTEEFKTETVRLAQAYPARPIRILVPFGAGGLRLDTETQGGYIVS